MPQWPDRDPEERTAGELDFGPHLSPGDSLASVVWTMPQGLTLLDDDTDGTLARVRFTGGTPGRWYDLKAHATTERSDVIPRSVRVYVTNR
jgi:hypothetical protein